MGSSGRSTRRRGASDKRPAQSGVGTAMTVRGRVRRLLRETQGRSAGAETAVLLLPGRKSQVDHPSGAQPSVGATHLGTQPGPHQVLSRASPGPPRYFPGACTRTPPAGPPRSSQVLHRSSRSSRPSTTRRTLPRTVTAGSIDHEAPARSARLPARSAAATNVRSTGSTASTSSRGRCTSSSRRTSRSPA